MWSRLSPIWKACTEEAWEAFMGGSVPIGAVVATVEGRIVSRGRNRVNEGWTDGAQLCNHRLAHAEINALLGVDCRAGKASGYALYTTLEPCPLCMGAFYVSGIPYLYYAARDGYAGSTDLLGTTHYLRRKTVTVYGPCLELEALHQTLHLAYGLSPLQPFHRQVLECVCQLYPKSAKLSQRLLEEGFFHQAVERRISAEELVSALAPQLEAEALTNQHGLRLWQLEGCE